MRVTWFIGNGFDINYGAKSRYKDFYEWVINNKKVEDNDIFKDIESDIESWADFEKQLCTNYINKIDIDITSQNMFIKDYDEFKDLLSEYLKIQVEKTLKNRENDSDIVIEETTKSIYNFYDVLLPEPREKIVNYLKVKRAPIKYNFIVFNYTGLFEGVLSKISTSNDTRLIDSGHINDSIEDIIDVHGTTDKDMIMGFGEKELVTNQEVLNNTDIRCSIIKTEHLASLEENTEQLIINKINSSTLIIIYGMSLGISDSNWWKRIIESAIRNDSYIIYFAHEPSYRRDIHSYKKAHIKEDIINNVCNNLKLDDNTIKKVKERLIISINADIFKYQQG